MMLAIGCGSVQHFGDVSLGQGFQYAKNAYSLNTPEFCVGATNRYIFVARSLPFPVLPDTCIFSSRTGEASSSPPWSSCKLMVRIYRYPDDVLLVSRLVQASIKGSNDWSGSHQTLWAKEDLDKVKCCSYTVIVDVLEPSTKRDGLARLYKFIQLPEP
jgi:hypothetical protein